MKLTKKELVIHQLANQDWTTLALKFPINIGKSTINLIGVHHHSSASVARVKQLIPQIKPSLICLELCPKIEKKNHKFKILSSSANEQKTVTRLTNDFMEAIEYAKAHKISIQYIDEPISNVLNRTKYAQTAISRFGIPKTPKLPIIFNMLTYLTFKRNIKNDLIKDLTSIGDMRTYCRLLRLKDDTITIRDACMAMRIYENIGKHDRIVAVVGKSHVFGIEYFLRKLHGNG